MQDYLNELKQYLRVFHSSDDDNLQFLLNSSTRELKDLVDSDMTDERFRELVYNRVRYAYNGDLEFFNENFQNAILDLSFHSLKEDADEEDI